MAEKIDSHFSVHTTPDLAKRIRERSRAFPSLNAYIVHALEAEMRNHAMKEDVEIAVMMRRIIELVSKSKPPG